jgi:hypothetical protein
MMHPCGRRAGYPAVTLRRGMDVFEAGCQGLGLALAIGMFGGALAGVLQGQMEDSRAVTGLLMVLAAAGAAIAFGSSLDDEGHAAWPGWVLGAIVAPFALVVVGNVVAGAARRAGEGGLVGFIAATAGFAALLLAVLALTPAAPVSIVVLLALAWIAIGRRRRADQKYEGLRILRG